MENIDIVYILGTGSRWCDNELRYSIRSVEKHVKNYRNIILVGQKPLFLNDKITFIPAKDTSRNKAKNILHKVLAAVECQEVSENFMFINDDYFFVKDFDAQNCPYQYKCNLEQTLEVNKTDYYLYAKTTMDVLKAKGFAYNNFDNHKPIIFNKQKMREVVNMYNWDCQYGYILKSLYCNTLGIEGSHFPDHKVVRPLLYAAWLDIIAKPEVAVFSIHDRTINVFFKRLLSELFPHASQFELNLDAAIHAKNE